MREAQTAVTSVQKRWRGLTQRVHVLRKWSWVVSNGLEHREEQRMIQLGLFVDGLEDELAPGPSIERRTSEGLKALTGQGAEGSDAPEQRCPALAPESPSSFPTNSQ